MPLPQQVINQLGRDHAESQGWLSGLVLFAFILLAITLFFYFGILLFYQPHLDTNLASAREQVATTDQSIASGDQAQLVAFYSQVLNIQSLLKNRLLFSQFLAWLEQHTEANIYYSQFSFVSGGQVSMTGFAKVEADVNQQAAIFESSPAVKKFLISSVTAAPSTAVAANQWSFSVTLTMDPSLMMPPSAFSTSTTPTP